MHGEGFILLNGDVASPIHGDRAAQAARRNGQRAGSRDEVATREGRPVEGGVVHAHITGGHIAQAHREDKRRAAGIALGCGHIGDRHRRAVVIEVGQANRLRKLGAVEGVIANGMGKPHTVGNRAIDDKVVPAGDSDNLGHIPVCCVVGEAGRANPALGRIATREHDRHRRGGLAVQRDNERDAGPGLAGVSSAEGRDIHPRQIIIGDGEGVDARRTTNGVGGRAEGGDQLLGVFRDQIVEDRKGQPDAGGTLGDDHRAAAQARVVAPRRRAAADRVGHRDIVDAGVAQGDPQAGPARALAHGAATADKADHRRRARVADRQGRRGEARDQHACGWVERDMHQLVRLNLVVREQRDIEALGRLVGRKGQRGDRRRAVVCARRRRIAAAADGEGNSDAAGRREIRHLHPHRHRLTLFPGQVRLDKAHT